jgi:putative salt-induced outer membrane protein YdiY
MTTGNSETSTLGIKNILSRAWERSGFTLTAGGTRAESTTTSRFAVGTPGSFSVTETEATQKTAENYYLNGKYDRKITETFFWFAGLGWDRNRFAGIENRYIAEAGVGNIWINEERIKFRTEYGVTFTDQEDVVEIAGDSDNWLGARFAWDYLHKFGANTTYQNLLVLDANLDDTDDWRADMINSVSVAMSEKLALKVSLQWLFDNQPSFSGAPLFDAPPPGGTLVGTVPVELDELDTIFTASLVVNF